LPLTPQVAFTLQSGDPVFRPPEAGGFVQLCRLDPLPVSTSPFRAPIASRSLPARWTHRGRLDVLVPVATLTLLVTGSVPSAETNQPLERDSNRGWFLKPALARLSALRHVSLSQCGRVRPRPGKRVKYATAIRPKPHVGGPSYQLSLTFYRYRHYRGILETNSRISL
jgi:hypothetical protein